MTFDPPDVRTTCAHCQKDVIPLREETVVNDPSPMPGFPLPGAYTETTYTCPECSGHIGTGWKPFVAAPVE